MNTNISIRVGAIATNLLINEKGQVTLDSKSRVVLNCGKMPLVMKSHDKNNENKIISQESENENIISQNQYNDDLTIKENNMEKVVEEKDSTISKEEKSNINQEISNNNYDIEKEEDEPLIW